MGSSVQTAPTVEPLAALSVAPFARQSASLEAERGFELVAASFAIEGRALLAPLSLGLARGRFYGLIGHNGSGKSTLLKLLARQQAPSAGEILFEGRMLPAWSARGFAQKVGYLPQSTAAGHGLTVRELVAFGRYPWHGPFGRRSPADRERIEEALELCRVQPFADRLVDTLSGGERQRAWIAMLVAQDADTLLLDEPISALDLGQQIEILGLLAKLSRTRGTGVIAVLHDINMAGRFCDEILALREGRLLVRGTPEAVMQEGVLADIYGIPMSVTAGQAGTRWAMAR